MNVTLMLKNHISHPYWAEKELTIRIEKDSGCNRLKSPEKKVSAIKAQCDIVGISYESYLDAVKAAKAQWYMQNGKIYIPRHQIHGALVQAVGLAPKALRGVFTKDNFRAMVQISDFVSNKTSPDGIYTRYVKDAVSNMRRLTQNEYVGEYLDKGAPVEFKGTICCDDNKLENVKRLMTEVVTNIGIGACRKMGWGRGEVEFN